MSLENSFLKETILTSTENKYLLKNNLTDVQEYSLIRFLQEADTNELISTTNEFLSKSDSVVPMQGIKHKKKRRRSHLYFSERFLRCGDEPIKRKKKKFTSSKICTACCEPSENAHSVSREKENGTDELDSYDCPPGFEFATNALAIPDTPAVFGETVLPKESIAGFGASGSEFQFSPYTANAPNAGLLFGSSPQSARCLAQFGNRRLSCAPIPLRKSAFVAEKTILEMPVYNFEFGDITVAQETYNSFNVELDDHNLTKVHQIKLKKIVLLNAASMALMCSANLKNTNAPFRVFIQNCADDVRRTDPEFILKVALYARQELNIRSVSNFLLSYASYHEDTRQFLEKYFESTIVLPSDWLEVADLYQTFNDKLEMNLHLPASLRRAMKNCFKKFDEYQLAKYNKGKKKKSDIKVKATEDSDKDIIDSPKKHTLKQMIRLLHIHSPANEVMCLLGKKYPETPDDFKKSGLSGIWNSKLAGKRMKLTQPMTWETQISANGNKPNVWEGLIDANKLPYMAMLRNLRNLILSGISPKHHDKVLNYLQNKNSVINCRQVPLQFYEAYRVICKLEELKTKVKENEADDEKSKEITVPWKKAQIRKISERIQNVSVSVLDRYKCTINKALEISSLHNLHPIPGRTLIICDVLIHRSVKKNKVFDLCIMMGLMCSKACEHFNMNLIYGDLCEKVAFEKDEDFLQILMHYCSQFQWMLKEQKTETSLSSVNGLNVALEFYLKQQTILSQKLDHIIFLRATQAENHHEIKESISSFLNKYRQTINPDLLYTDVDLSVNKDSFTDMSSEDTKDIYLHGSSPQLIKFIAERSSDGQLLYVENIDAKYNLKSKHEQVPIRYKNGLSKEEEILSTYSRVPKWHSVRIFISSTFKDMHSERDILVRYVIPELKKRAASIFVKINEVDLRWGITETDCASKRAAELCLIEAQKSDLFIGMLGERYGAPCYFGPPDSPDLQWVKDFPQGLSITELEMHAGALRQEKLLKKKGFFYFRNNSFMSQVPEKWKDYFAAENNESEQKIKELKSKICSSGLKVVEDYPCQFAGIFKGKPILSGLEFFGKAVLEDLWFSVSQIHEKEPYQDTVKEEEYSQQSLLSHFDCFIGERNSLADNFLKKILKEHGIFLISGSSGSGKTTFVVNLLEKLKNFIIIKFFIGLTPKSADVNYMLQFVAGSIERKLSVSVEFPKSPIDIKNNFPDILQEATKCTNGNLVLVLDGLDHLEPDAQTLDWLPLVLPDDIRLIVSASNSSSVYKLLCKRQDYGNVIHIENLTTLPQCDRESIVRHYLNRYGKTLDESSFNNQMLHIVTKKDSGVPLYLRLACDYLRAYASFENFTSMLQSMPTSVPLLFQEILIQMENEYTGSLVQAAFTLLCIAKEGLEDRDLHLLLSVVSLNSKNDIYLSFEETTKKIESLEKDNLLPQISFYSSFHLICTFAFGYIRSANLNLVGTEIEKAVKKFYLNKNSIAFEKNMHFLLAAYYYTVCDPEMKGIYKTYSKSAFRALLYHLFHGKCFKELAYLLCNLDFLEVIFKLNADDILIEYYSYLIEKSQQGSHDVKDINVSVLISFKSFILRNMHILKNHPELIVQQALNEPPESVVKMNNKERKLTCMFEYFSQPNVFDYRLSTLSGFMKPITALSCHERKSVAALGSEDGYLKILDFESKKIIRNLKNHTSAISFICFGAKNRICTASNDGTLNIWSCEDYSLLSTLKGHRRNVTGCCSDPSGSVLLSCGWDNSIRLWSLRDGRSISVIDDFKCPVNCIDHHPMKQQVACGLWNGNLEIWDTVSLKKIIMSTSQCGSIKSVAFSPDGVNIISSFISSEVAIWSAEAGLKLSCLTGHTLPVKSIVFSYERNIIVSGSQDCTLKVWPTETGLPINTLTSCKYYPISMLGIISRDFVVICLQNSEVWVVNMYTDQIVSKLLLSSEIITSISKQDRESSLIQEGIDGQWLTASIVLGTESGKILIGNFETSSTTDVGVLKSRITSITHNATFIICGNSTGDIGVFSFPDFKSSFIYGAHPGSVTSLFLYTSYMKIFSSGYDKIVKSWFVDNGDDGPNIKHAKDYITNHKDSITSCHYTYIHDDFLITGSHDNTLVMKNSFDEEVVLTGLKTSVMYVSYINKYIIGCGSDGSIAMWSITGKLATYVPGIDQSSAVLSFFIEKDANSIIDITLAYVDKNGTVKITKPIQKSYWYSLEGHSKSITSCCVNRNGEILSSSLDGTLNFWKVDLDIPDSFSNHKSSITGVLILVSQRVMMTSDMLGNIIMWKLLEKSSEFSVVCVAKKSYTSGFIKAMAWLKEDTFISAITQINEEEEFHFLDIIRFKRTDIEDQDLYYLQVTKSHHFKSEILCLDASSVTDTIVASFKSGEIAVITPNSSHLIQTNEGWITGAKLWLSDDSIEYLFICPLSGQVKHTILISEILNNIPYMKLASRKYLYSKSLYTTTFCCENEDVFYCGDTEGNLRAFKTGKTWKIKKVHLNTVTGIVVAGSYIFTSSLDRTVKVFISCTLQQVGMFYSSAPVTCLVVKEVPENSYYILGVGTQSGSVELLKFHPII